jgi:uncharacterized protein (DUF2141 family)
VIVALLTALALSAPVTVQVTGATSSAGQLIAHVYCDKSDWLDQAAACHTATAPLAWERGTLTLELPPGAYTLTVFHDGDGDGVMRTAWPIPIPKDATAISNNHRPRFGPPSWSASLFTVPEAGLTQELVLIQP